MKKVLHKLTLLPVCLLVISVLAACGGSSSKSTEAETTTAEPDFEGWRTVETSDVLEGVTMSFDVLPSGYSDYESETGGTVESLYYTTNVYGEPQDKYLTVYLPYGYDPDDTETKYNVIYFQHGNGGAPNKLWRKILPDANDKNMLDNMLYGDNQVMEANFILVCPTYYFGLDESVYGCDGVTTTGGDGRSGDIDNNYYYKELVEDIIPLVESTYNTYTEDTTTKEGLIASRDHRCFAGYSRGAGCTWYIMHNDFEYFKYFMPMSCAISPEMNSDDPALEGDEWSYEQQLAYITGAIDAHPDYDFVLLGSAGGVNDAASMKELMAYFYADTAHFSYGTDPAVNNFYFTCSDFEHDDLYWIYTLYNMRDILFH